jgi:ribonucleoside-diphosphate reductase alpha chain
VATELGVEFLDAVIDVSGYPTWEINEWAKTHRAIGLGVMGYADMLLMKELSYGSEEANNLLKQILSFIYKVAEEKSVQLGEEKGVPDKCKNLPTPRRNITLTTVAPTGTVSLLAGCSSGVEPIFSEITIRNDKTGTYTFENDLANKPYFKCAVSANGAQEVTWEEHISTLSSAQKYIDSGVSKTTNFPKGTHRDTIAKAVIKAWEEGCKGLAVYRNGSRKVEVLSPKNVKKELCPICGGELIKVNDKLKCLTCNIDTMIEESSTYYD